MFNPNDFVEIKPSKSGWRSIIKYTDAFNASVAARNPDCTFRMTIPKANAEGYILGQFWCLMQYFDWSICGDIPFDDLRLPNPSDDRRASARPVNHVVGQTFLPERG
jgi:hypothetical protein